MATLRFTRRAYTLKKPRKPRIASAYLAGIHGKRSIPRTRWRIERSLSLFRLPASLCGWHSSSMSIAQPHCTGYRVYTFMTRAAHNTVTGSGPYLRPPFLFHNCACAQRRVIINYITHTDDIVSPFSWNVRRERIKN